MSFQGHKPREQQIYYSYPMLLGCSQEGSDWWTKITNVLQLEQVKHGAGRMYHAGDCDWLQLKSKKSALCIRISTVWKEYVIGASSLEKKLNEGMKFDWNCGSL